HGSRGVIGSEQKLTQRWGVWAVTSTGRPRCCGDGRCVVVREAQSSTSTRPRSTARARRRGTLTSRPPERTGTRSAGCAFHCERRERVLLRDTLRLGTAMGPTSPSVLVTDAPARGARAGSHDRQEAPPGGSAQALAPALA